MDLDECSARPSPSSYVRIIDATAATATVDDGVRQSYAVLCCASGSDLRFDERGQTVHLRVTVYAQ